MIAVKSIASDISYSIIDAIEEYYATHDFIKHSGNAVLRNTRKGFRASFAAM